MNGRRPAAFDTRPGDLVTTTPTAPAARGRGLTWALLAGALVLLVIGGIATFATFATFGGSSAGAPDGAPPAAPGSTGSTMSGQPPASAGATVPPAPAPSSTPPAHRRPGNTQKHPRLHPGEPTELRIRTLGVIAPVVPILAPDRTLVPPSDPQTLGWWSPGAKPGVGRGSALITGHTVHTGGGALDHLGDLEVGALVEVRTPRLRMPYVVRKVRSYSKGRVSQDAARLFDQSTIGRLVIITCGDWNGSEYLSNVVVTAVPQHGAAYLAAHPTRAGRLAPNVLPIRGR